MVSIVSKRDYEKCEVCSLPKHNDSDLCAFHFGLQERGEDLREQTRDEKRLCSRAECPRGKVSLGYCQTHYAQYNKTGRTKETPLRDGSSTSGVCSFVPCGRPARTKGLCSSHADQDAKGVELRPLRGDVKEICYEPTCNEVVASWGLCSGHYQQVRSGKELTPIDRTEKSKICIADVEGGCDKPAASNELCPAHDKQRKVKGFFTPINKGREISIGMYSDDPAIVFKTARDYSVVNENGCWVWQKYKTEGGYPRLHSKREGRTDMVHRLVLEAKVGYYLGKNEAHHTCDSQHDCVNPDHLIVASKKDNIIESRVRNAQKKLNAEYETRILVLEQIIKNEIGADHPVLQQKHTFDTTVYKLEEMPEDNNNE